MKNKNGLTYAGAGVDIDAGNAMVEKIKPLVRATRRPGADAEIGGFGGIFDLKAAGFTDPILVAANDGVGTKVKIATLTGIHGTIGIDLVAMCVNDLVVQGAEPLFFLDYYATGKLDPAAGAEVVKGIAQGCIEAGAALIGGETAEMPGLYSGADYDLAGFAVGAVERGKLLPRADVKAGDHVLGLRSSGLHSNGFSLVRKIVEQASLAWTDPAPFAPGKTLGEALLAPTRIYVKPVLRVLAETDGVKALAHITGGGIPDNVPRALPKNLGVEIDLSAIPVPRGLRLARGKRRRRRSGDAAHVQLRHRNGCHCRFGQGRRGFARLPLGRGRRGRDWPRRGDRGGRAGRLFRAARVVTFRRKRTAILISGRGSNMRALIEHARNPSYPAEIALVLSNRPDAAGLTFAKENNIACAVVDHKIYAGREEFERSMQVLLGLQLAERLFHFTAQPLVGLRPSRKRLNASVASSSRSSLR